jgi:Zn-dependent peptidase ImmA (M78 family)
MNESIKRLRRCDVSDLSQSIERSNLDPLKRFAEIYGVISPEEAMTEACHEIRQASGELFPPIGLSEILSILDIEQVNQNGQGPFATLSKNDSKFFIRKRRFNERGWRKTRFSIAHEIGHVILIKALAEEEKFLLELRNQANWKPIELLCHYAASEILVPRGDFINQVGHLAISDINFEFIFYLYDRYKVSFEVILRKIMNQFFDVLIFWKEKKSKDGIEYFIHKVHWKEDFFVPKLLTARKHLFPNVFNFPATFDDCFYQEDTAIKFGKVEYSGISVSSIYPKRKKMKNIDQMMFKGFSIPDESPTFNGFTLLKVT